MRPETVPQADIDKWEVARVAYNETHPENLVPIPPDVWHSGEWLYEQLLANNCTKELAEQIGFALSQKQAFTRNYWELAQKTLDDYKRGVWDIPGPALAMRLLKERFGERPDPVEIFQALIADGADPKKLSKMYEEAIAKCGK